MNKKILAAAIAAAIVAPAAVAADVTVSGQVNLAMENFDYGQVDQTRIQNYTSRIGFAGSEDLGDGLKAIFKVEMSLDIANDKDGGGNNEFSGGTWGSGMNTYVGLAGDFGTVLIGRHDHPVKMSTGKFDYFGDTVADYNNGTSTGAPPSTGYAGGVFDLRADGAVAYVSPNFSGLTVAAAIVPGEDSSVASGGNGIADSLADAYSVAAMYSNGGIDVSVGYEEGDKGLNGVLGAANTTSDYEQTRVGAGYSMDNWAVNVVWANVQVDDSTTVATDFDVDTWQIAGKYTMGNNTLKAKWFDVDETATAANDGYDGWAVGLEHAFSKRTNAQLIYIASDGDTTNAANDGDAISLELKHKF